MGILGGISLVLKRLHLFTLSRGYAGHERNAGTNCAHPLVALIVWRGAPAPKRGPGPFPSTTYRMSRQDCIPRLSSAQLISTMAMFALHAMASRDLHSVYRKLRLTHIDRGATWMIRLTLAIFDFFLLVSLFLVLTITNLGVTPSLSWMTLSASLRRR